MGKRNEQESGQINEDQNHLGEIMLILREWAKGMNAKVGKITEDQNHLGRLC